VAPRLALVFVVRMRRAVMLLRGLVVVVGLYLYLVPCFCVFCWSGVCDHAGMLNPAMAVARGARRLPDPFAKFTFWGSSVPVGTKVWLQGAFHPENFQTTFICGYFDQSVV